MATYHRVEIVARRPSERYDLWRSQDGSITLRRDRTEAEWTAILDGTPVFDESQMETSVDEMVLLQARSARGLAELLSMQEHVHLLFVADPPA